MAVNLLAATGDPGFEKGSGSPGASTNATYTRLASTVMSGSFVARLAINADGAATLSLPGTLAPPVTPGLPYSVSVYGLWNAGTPKQSRIDFRWLDSTRTVIQTDQGTPVTFTAAGAAGMQRITYAGVVAPAGAAYLNVRLGMQGSPIVGDEMYFDRVQIEQSATVTAYNETVPPTPITGYPFQFKLTGVSAAGTPAITAGAGGTAGTGDVTADGVNGTPPKVATVDGWANNPVVKMDQVAGTNQLLRFTAQGAVDQWSAKLRIWLGANDTTNGHTIVAFLDDAGTLLVRLTRTASGFLRLVGAAGTLATSAVVAPTGRWLHIEISNDNTATDPNPKTSVDVWYWDTRVAVLSLDASGWTGQCGQVWLGNEKTATAPAEPWYADDLEVVQGTVPPTWTESYDTAPVAMVKTSTGTVKPARLRYVKKAGATLKPTVGGFPVRPTLTFGGGGGNPPNPTGKQLIGLPTTPAATVGDPDLSGTVTEASGLVWSTKNSTAGGLVGYTHNDGDALARIFAIDDQSPFTDVLAEIRLGGVASGAQFEDIAKAFINGKRYLYIGQIGNGAGTVRMIHRIEEPSIAVNQAKTIINVDAANVVTFSYTTPYTDSEAFVVANNGDIVLFEKKSAGSTAVRPVTGGWTCYAGVAGAATSRTIAPTTSGTIRGIQDSTNNGGLTGGDLSDDNRLLVLCNYNELWALNLDTTLTLAQNLAANPVLPLHSVPGTAWGAEALALVPGADPDELDSLPEGVGSTMKRWTLTYDDNTPNPPDPNGQQPKSAYAVLNYAHLGVHGTTTGITGSKAENYYLQENQSTPNANVTSQIKADIDAGKAVFITITTKTTLDMPTRVVAGNAAALAWMDEFAAWAGPLAAYAAAKDNGGFVAFSYWHESSTQINTNGLTSSYDDFGKAQQIGGRKLKTAIAAAGGTGYGFWILWLAGYEGNRTNEGNQVRWCTNPKPDIFSTDPYANQSGTQTLLTIAEGDFNWMKTQPCYFDGQVFALTETAGKTNVFSATQLATFYTDWPGKAIQMMKDVGVPICAIVDFNSNVGTASFHLKTPAANPQAIAAEIASFANQATYVKA